MCLRSTLYFSDCFSVLFYVDKTLCWAVGYTHSPQPFVASTLVNSTSTSDPSRQNNYTGQQEHTWHNSITGTQQQAAQGHFLWWAPWGRHCLSSVTAYTVSSFLLCTLMMSWGGSPGGHCSAQVLRTQVPGWMSVDSIVLDLRSQLLI